MDATTILQTITLAVSGWALLEIIAMKTKVARMEQRLDDGLHSKDRHTDPDPTQNGGGKSHRRFRP